VRIHAALDAAIRASGAGLICLAGFMRLLTADFVAAWRDRMINIHPSLLPAFLGLHTHERALAAGCRFAGCTVHFVRPEMDTGPIIAQSAVPVHAHDDASTLAARVLDAEHLTYPLALRWIAEGRVRVEKDGAGERAVVAGASAPDGMLVNPVG
jgi:phosphoribosylglycinamide formyltransferase-1